jgi:hypothetical protein
MNEDVHEDILGTGISTDIRHIRGFTTQSDNMGIFGDLKLFLSCLECFLQSLISIVPRKV